MFAGSAQVCGQTNEKGNTSNKGEEEEREEVNGLTADTNKGLNFSCSISDRKKNHVKFGNIVTDHVILFVVLAMVRLSPQHLCLLLQNS